MADELQTTMDALDVIGQVFELGSTFAVATGPLGAAIPFIGAILGLIGNFLPDRKHEQILQGLRKLSTKIDLVRGDIQQLETEIKWEITQATYANPVHDIMLGIEYVQEIGKASGNATRMTYLKKLRDHCSWEKCSSALTFILNGVNGKGQRPMLDTFYDKTGGNRPYISALGTRLLQLVCGGMIVVSTYDTAKHGVERAKAVIQNYNRQLNEARSKFQFILKKCVNEFKTNMLTDLNKELDHSRSNKDHATNISDLMRDKYDWLENFVIVYNDLHGSDKHYFNGKRVHSIHYKDKVGIVYYRTKGKPPRFSNRYDEAYNILNRDCYHAQSCYNDITKQLIGRGIGFTGCAVIITTGKTKPEPWGHGTFSTKTVYVDRKNRYWI